MTPRPLLLLALLAACGDKKVAPPPPVVAKPDPKPALAAAAPVAADARATLGEALAARLEFAAEATDQDRVVAVVPKGWKEQDGVRTPPGEAELGAMSSLAVGTGCAGTCSAKDWPSAAVKQELGPLSGVDFTTVKSEDLPDGKLVISKSIDRTYVVLLKWKIGAPRYAYCKATLDQELGDAVNAFEKACRGLTVLSWE